MDKELNKHFIMILGKAKYICSRQMLEELFTQRRLVFRVLYFSTHRYENGTFWPHLEESDYNYIGDSTGRGFNVNVPLNTTGLGNSDFLSIWHNILLPMAYEVRTKSFEIEATLV